MEWFYQLNVVISQFPYYPLTQEVYIYIGLDFQVTLNVTLSNVKSFEMF